MSNIIGKRIQELLNKKEMTQTALAEQIKLDKLSVNRIINGKNYPSMKTLNKICDVFNISLSEFFSPTELKQNSSASSTNNLTDVVEIKDVFDTPSLNDMLQKGWFLIKAGIEQHPYYTVGRTSTTDEN